MKKLMAVLVVLVALATVASAATSTNVTTNSIGQVVTTIKTAGGQVISTTITGGAGPAAETRTFVNASLGSMTNAASSLGPYIGGNIPRASITNADADASVTVRLTFAVTNNCWGYTNVVHYVNGVATGLTFKAGSAP